ncbi:hypothetical protein ACHAP8_008981 [Fusarium lateritium]
MAVLDEIPHITARVRVAGELATEYGVPDDFEMIDHARTANDTTPTKHCYIECKSGAEFAIEVTVSSGFNIPMNNDAVWMDVYIDGEYRRSGRIIKRKSLEKKHVTATLSSALFSAAVGVGLVKKFTFAPITKDDSASKSKVEEDALRAKDLGVIKIVIVTGTDLKQQYKASPCPTLTDQQQEFAEKALKGKGISHTTTFAETGPIVPIPDTCCVKNVVIAGNFFFHYQSHEALQHEMIIPRTPSLEPPVVAEDGEDVLSRLSESEIRRLAMERLRDNNIKQESSGIKREADEHPATTRPWKVVKLDDGKEAVDLTDE